MAATVRVTVWATLIFVGMVPVACGTLESESMITVGSTVGELSGDINVVLEDTRDRGPGKTSFLFLLSDQEPGDPLGPEETTVTIEVNSPNGDANIRIRGTID